MLTIAFVLSALSLLAVASPAPVEQRGIRIPLSRRVDGNTTVANGGDRIVDLDSVKAAVNSIVGSVLQRHHHLSLSLYLGR